MEVGFILAGVVVNALLLVVLLGRASRRAPDPALLQSLQQLNDQLERTERELRFEITESSRGGRQELTQNLASFQQSQVQQLALMQKTISDTLHQQLQQLQAVHLQPAGWLRGGTTGRSP
mgnify:CR=1 FL=1